MRLRTFLLALLLGEISLASWWALQAGDSRAPAYAAKNPFDIDEVARFDEVARCDLGNRIRAIAESEDGALYVLEDGSGGRLLRILSR